jgi:hypothetical protein
MVEEEEECNWYGRRKKMTGEVAVGKFIKVNQGVR